MKPIAFKLKPEPDESRQGNENQEWKDYPVRDYPKVPTWMHIAGLAALIGGVGLGYWMGGGPGSCAGLIAGFTACFVLVVYFHPLRCPQCRGRVSTRELAEANDAKRFYHDCSACRISWKSPKPHWDSSDD